MQGKRVKALKKYLSKDDRVDVCLAQLIKLYKEKPSHPALNIFLKKPLSAMIAFKSLILLHNLLHEQAVDLSLSSTILKGMAFNAEKEFDAIISQKYLNPYRLFLQRRCQIDLSEEAESGEQKKMLTLQLINLIKAVSTFQQVIYIFGRYFAEKYKFIIDFNIVLAKDICKVYTTLQEQLPPPYSFEFLKEIELIHETMYPIFFNNYFYQYLRAYKPKWIITMQVKQERTAPKKSESKRPLDSTREGVSEQLDRSFDAESVELQNQKQEEYLVRQFVIGEEAGVCQLKKQEAEVEEAGTEIGCQSCNLHEAISHA